jgi:hypothetical protein
MSDGSGYTLPPDWATMDDSQRERWAFRQKHPDGSWISPPEQSWRIKQYNAISAVFTTPAYEEPARSSSDGSPFRILSRADLRRLPRVSWLIEGLIQTSGLVVLAGDGGIGKSAIAIDWAATIAAGIDKWHGRKVASGSNVLYVAGEGVEGFEDRLQAWEAANGRTIPEERMGFISEGFSLSSERATVHLEMAVRERDYALVILDTLSQLSSVDNENDNAELSRVLNAARSIRQARPGTTVMIVHHVSKGGRVRGASAIRNNADAVIVARADAGANVSTFSLTTEHEFDGKQKNGPAETIDGFWLDSLGAGVIVRRGGADDISRAILSVLQDGQDHDGNDFYIAALAADDATKKAVRRRLKDLVDAGTAVASGVGKAARWKLAP